MNVSAAGVALVKSFEGFSPTIYDDGTGVRTIGYGTTTADVAPLPAHLTEPQAAALLQRQLDERYAPAVAALHVPLKQHQFDALVSFVYNVGPGALSPATTIGRDLRAARYLAAGDALLAWDRAGGRVLPGLLRRRRAERALFLRGEDPLEGFTSTERSWIHEFDLPTTSAGRRAALALLMRAQRKRIWHAAQPHWWGVNHRQARYNALLARSA